MHANILQIYSMPARVNRISYAYIETIFESISYRLTQGKQKAL